MHDEQFIMHEAEIGLIEAIDWSNWSNLTIWCNFIYIIKMILPLFFGLHVDGDMGVVAEALF